MHRTAREKGEGRGRVKRQEEGEEEEEEEEGEKEKEEREEDDKDDDEDNSHPEWFWRRRPQAWVPDSKNHHKNQKHSLAQRLLLQGLMPSTSSLWTDATLDTDPYSQG